MDRLLEIVKENRLFATANQKLAAPRVPGDAAGHAFAEARALLHAERWPEATMAFGEIALAYPHDALGIVAAMLYLEGLNMLGSVPDHPRPDCFQEMRDQLPALQQLYCENGENRRHPRECLVFFRIERSLGQRTGCGISEPSKEPPEVLYARVGAEYLALAIRCVEVTRLADVSPLDDQCDDFAFYAARAFLNVPNRTRAGLARAVLLDPKNGMLKSPRVQDLEKLWK